MDQTTPHSLVPRAGSTVGLTIAVPLGGGGGSTLKTSPSAALGWGEDRLQGVEKTPQTAFLSISPPFFFPPGTARGTFHKAGCWMKTSRLRQWTRHSAKGVALSYQTTTTPHCHWAPAPMDFQCDWWGHRPKRVQPSHPPNIELGSPPGTIFFLRPGNYFFASFSKGIQENLNLFAIFPQNFFPALRAGFFVPEEDQPSFTRTTLGGVGGWCTCVSQCVPCCL